MIERFFAAFLFIVVLLAQAFAQDARLSSVTTPINVNVFDYQSSQPSVPIGTGGDDQPAIQAAVNAVLANAGGGTVIFPVPPSGTYNVCTDSIRINNTSGHAITLRGVTSGASAISILPGCGSPPAQVIYINVSDAVTKSKGRVLLDNLRIDAYCLANYGVNSDFTVGMTFTNVVVRNSVAGTGNANVRLGSGYEFYAAKSVRFENINDTGHTCYSTPATFPDYNLFIDQATDARVSAVAVGAFVANFYQAAGGANHFIASHGWGYPSSNGDSQVQSRPQYNYWLKGPATLDAAIGDQPLTAGVRTEIGTSSNDGVVAIGYNLNGPTEASVIGVSYGTGVTNSIVAFSTLNGLNDKTKCMVSDTSFDVTVRAFGNSYCSQASQINSIGAAAQETALQLVNPNNNSFSTTFIDLRPNNTVHGRIGAQQSGSTANGIVFFNTNQSSSVAERARIGNGLMVGLTVDKGFGTINTTTYYSGGTAGVTCAGAPTGSFASTGGIVTHC
jgi:hypothetical protein